LGAWNAILLRADTIRFGNPDYFEEDDMQTFETSLHYRLVRMGDNDPLTKPRLFADYMRGAFTDCADTESLWLISMNPKRRPISRTLLRAGPMAATITPPRDLFKVALLAEARAIAVVRGEPNENMTMTKHDHRVVMRLGETAGWLGIEFLDYLVVSTRDDTRKAQFHSWRQPRRD
jgi:DNA repair protein RadC